MDARGPFATACFLCLSALLPATAEPLSEDEILEGAADRIAEHRMGDASVKVVGPDGDAVSGAKLKIEQTRHDFLFGSNIFGWHQADEEDAAKYRDQFAALLNYATLPFYWGSFEGEKGQPGYDRIDPMAEWCQENGITTKGHPLVWNMVPPRWLGDDLDEIKEQSDARVAEIIERYKDRIDIWDVVNEATDPFRFQNPMTEMWRYVGRIQLVLDSFDIAREASPEATLLINDYRVGEEYVETIKQLVGDDGARLYDKIGIQSHMHRGAWAPQRTWDVCERFAQFDVPLHFTETTVVSGPREGDKWAATTPELEERQAEHVARFYTIIFSHPATEALTWWDFSDRGAWQGAAAGFLRKDLTPKPVYEKLMSLIKGEWWTEIEAETSDDGLHEFRGFYGDYRITATGPDGDEASIEVRLERGEDNGFSIEL